jgi:hypothetical protein
VIGRDRLAWGLVGGLSYLVLAQAYELVVGQRIGLAPKLGVAVLVTAVTIGLLPLIDRRLGSNGSA